MIDNAQPETLRSPLVRLAEACGVEDGFVDAAGARRETTDGARRALLRSLGIAAATDDEVAASLETRHRSLWQTVLPPVRVAVHGSVSVEVTLPAGDRTLTWRLRLEDGSEREATVDFAAIAVLDASERVDATTYERRTLALPADVPLGYHRFSIGDATTSLVVVPERCYVPSELSRGERVWGVALQLYLVRSERDWGIGDFGDLARLVTAFGVRGADVVGVNPLHALFLDDPEHASPYAPASRLLLNALNIDVSAVPGYDASSAIAALASDECFARELEAARASEFVRYTDVAASKLAALRALYVERRVARSDDWVTFEAFVRSRDDAFSRACGFLALRDARMREDAAQSDWRRWPEAYRDPESADVAAFVKQREGEVTFYAWLQWIADEQLERAATAARDAGMCIGLYRDLAVGVDPRGVETWSDRAAIVPDTHVGAPPDLHNPAGQDWGLPPFHPQRLQASGYESFIALLRANMRHAGAIRIDHVMALQHVYTIAAGASPGDGAYLAYPLEEMLGIIALESTRNRCLVIGEDLGTVPAGFRERMAAANVLSYRVLYFEGSADGERFVPPAEYPALALAVVGNHDLPTLRAWFAGSDIDLKERLGRYPTADEAARQRATRAHDRAALFASLADAGLAVSDDPLDDEATLDAVHRYLARTPAMLALAQLDDLSGEREQVNVPATSDERPNWRRRQSTTLEALVRDERFERAVAAFRSERGRGERSGVGTR